MILILTICALLSSIVFAQNVSVEIEIMLDHFKNFEYEKVISVAEKILTNKSQIAEADLLKIYEMQAISYYSLFDKSSARSSFIEILKINPDFILDPIRTSPKIISFFNVIKENIENYIEPSQEKLEAAAIDTVELILDSGKILKGALVRSACLPGWGQSYLGDHKKGLFLGAISVIALTSTIYFSIDCANKQNDYLNEIDKSLMDDKYNRYNTSYRTRNLLLTSCALIWLYTEIDIMLFQQSNINEKVKVGIKPSLGISQSTLFYCSISF